MPQLPNDALVLITGNNIAYAADFVRRVVHIRLDPKMPEPWTRSNFKHPDLVAWTLENRANILWAVFTLARSWILAGRKAPSSAVPAFGSFEAWRNTIGGVMEHSGFDGFLSNLPEFTRKADGDTSELIALLSTWHECIGDDAISAKEYFQRAESRPELIEALPGCVDPNSKRPAVSLGKYLKRHRGTRCGDRWYFADEGKRDSHNKTMTWIVGVDR